MRRGAGVMHLHYAQLSPRPAKIGGESAYYCSSHHPNDRLRGEKIGKWQTKQARQSRPRPERTAVVPAAISATESTMFDNS